MLPGKLIQLSSLEWEDAQRCRPWVNDPEIMDLMDRISPVDLPTHQKWYEKNVADPSAVLLGIHTQENLRLIGYAWITAIHKRHSHAEVRIQIGDKSCWGKGMGTETLRVLATYAFQHLHLHKLYAYVLETNPRSLKAFENAGFKQEGLLIEERYINGSFINVHRMALLNQSA